MNMFSHVEKNYSIGKNGVFSSEKGLFKKI